MKDNLEKKSLFLIGIDTFNEVNYSLRPEI